MPSLSTYSLLLFSTSYIKHPHSYLNASCGSVRYQTFPLFENRQKRFCLFLCNQPYVYQHTGMPLFLRYCENKNFCLPALPPYSIQVFPYSKLLQDLSVLTSRYLHQCPPPIFFLNPSNHFYFLAPLCKNIHFKIMNDLYITTLECRPTHLFLLVFLF